MKRGLFVRIGVILATIELASGSLFPLLAIETTATSPAGLRKEIRQEIKEDKRELKKDVKALKKIGTRLTIAKAVLTAKGGDTAPTTLTVVKDGKTYTINISTATMFRRRFGGKGTLSEISVNDTLGIVGKWVDEAQTTIDAKLVRDESIQKRLAVFVGRIQSINGSTFVLESVARGTQTVTVSSTTKYVARNQKVLTLADIKVGHMVRVKGLWNRQLNTVTEVNQVKDYSLPIVPTKSTNSPTSPTTDVE